MNNDDIEPLETGTWLRQLRRLATKPPQSEEALIRSLRQGFYLAQLAPRPLRHVVGCSLPEREFERLLESGELLAAALALVGDQLNHNLTCVDGAGRIEADVWFPSRHAGNPVSGPAAPFAIYQAWLQCLATLDERLDFNQLAADPPARRKSRSSPRQKLTEH